MAEPVLTHSDVTTTMRLIGDISDGVRDIRDAVVEDDNGEETEDPEADG